MVYENSLEELERISKGFGFYAFSGETLQKETVRILLEEATYYEACIHLKKEEIPIKFPEIKTAERLYKEGKIHEANNILHYIWNELEFLTSIGKEDIKYYGN